MKRFINLIFLNIGFTAGIAQILFLRELLSFFQGNEITIGIVLICWFLWTAAGSYLGGKFFNETKNLKYFLLIVLSLYFLFLPITLLIMRLTIVLVNPIPGFEPGIGKIFLFTLMSISFFCFLSGSSFAVASIFIKREGNYPISQATGRLYGLESFGSALGGIVLSLFFIQRFDGLTLALVLNVLSIILLILPVFHLFKEKYFILGSLAFYFTLIMIFYATTDVSRAYPWRNFTSVNFFNSKYGKLTLIQSEHTKTLYSNNVPLFTYPDKETAEESVHFAMLQHPHPEQILIIGNGFWGPIQEVLKYASIRRIDYVELDPEIIMIEKNYLNATIDSSKLEEKLHCHITDGRRFLKKSPIQYDLIILNAPEPNSVQFNRYYTLEFYKLAYSKLAKDGILTFRFNGSENYINHELALFLKCIYKTVNSVFDFVSTYPGETIHFFACKSPGILTEDPDILINQIHKSQLKLQYIREYFIPFRLSPERIRNLKDRISPELSTPINMDFKPIACFRYLSVWSGKYSTTLIPFINILSETQPFDPGILFVLSILVLFLIYRWFSLKNKSGQLSAAISVFITGFSLMGIEVLALLIFQAQMGYIYYQIALLIAGFMAGMGSGVFLAIKYRLSKSETYDGTMRLLIVIHFAMSFIPLIVAHLTPLVDYGPPSVIIEILFLFSSLLGLYLAGLFGGMVFPIAGHLFYRESNTNSGSLYSIDLLGALAGTFIINIMIIPVTGFYSAAWFLSGLQLIAILFFTTVLLSKK